MPPGTVNKNHAEVVGGGDGYHGLGKRARTLRRHSPWWDWWREEPWKKSEEESTKEQTTTGPAVEEMTMDEPVQEEPMAKLMEGRTKEELEVRRDEVGTLWQNKGDA